jgi:hypothetical protein
MPRDDGGVADAFSHCSGLIDATTGLINNMREL